jgi:hypothetical protein
MVGSQADPVVHEPIEFAGKVITPQNLYIGLFVIGMWSFLHMISSPERNESGRRADASGLPLLWWAAPLSTFFWLVGSSGCIVGAHAGLLEPGVES